VSAANPFGAAVDRFLAYLADQRRASPETLRAYESDLAQFVATLATRLEPGSVVAILDNSWAHGSSTPISRKDAEGNTYQVRTLANGDAFEVLKNYPTTEELADAVRGVAREAHLEALQYYWLLVFTLK